MNEKSLVAVVSVILVAAIVMIPVGIAALLHQAEPYRIVEGEPLREAAEAAGLRVCNVTDTLWNVPGATGGTAYVISDSCTDPDAETIRVEVQAFDSEESRDAALRTYLSQSVGRARPVGSLIVVGQYLVYVEPYDSDLFKRLAPELKKK
ncbi:hypothetical protein [Methanofollis fontis]|uniref:Uncharacterized protein n=1 Tax=Methanofollis fontis TaxID=2052832 RepID=A0A483CR68_9EURY|nr:hypothetical protein [Methanofollis fontis]TAJ44671.1 hypothetical protein CUJ86_05025 [Methanofollis fontis]